MKLTIGDTYDVTIDDCCVEGKFTSKLVEAFEYDENKNKVTVAERGYGETLVFENGVTLIAMNGVNLKERVAT